MLKSNRNVLIVALILLATALYLFGHSPQGNTSPQAQGAAQSDKKPLTNDSVIIIADGGIGTLGPGVVKSYRIKFSHKSGWTCDTTTPTCTATAKIVGQAKEWDVIDDDNTKSEKLNASKDDLFKGGNVPAASVSGNLFTVKNCKKSSANVVMCSSKTPFASLIMVGPTHEHVPRKDNTFTLKPK
jgi:hypothetical protein